MDNFDDWWNEDYDDSQNPFEKDSFGYWAYAGWCAAMQVEKREWVELTVKELTEIVDFYIIVYGHMDLPHSFARALEAKLKEKNIR